MWHQGIARRRCTDGLCPNGLDCPAGRTYRGEYAPRPLYQPCPDDCGTCDSNLHVRLSYAYGARSSSRRSKRERGTAMSSPFSFALAIYHQLARHDSCEQKVGPKPRSCPTTSSRSAPSTRRTLATAVSSSARPKACRCEGRTPTGMCFSRSARPRAANGRRCIHCVTR
jgi:hypothetical protein